MKIVRKIGKNVSQKMETEGKRKRKRSGIRRGDEERGGIEE
jgi:hypothetical protein